MPRVLLADDHLIVRQGLKVLLQREGFEIVGEAADGQQAVRLARDRCPDVAVPDFAMPVLNGLGAAREIPRMCPPAPGILLTLHTEDRHVHEAPPAGTSRYILEN